MKAAPIAGRWLQRLSMLLELPEREVVLGDLAEEQVGTLRSVLNILGLALRRELAHWNSAGPWLATGALVLPGMVLLVVNAHRFAVAHAIYLWLFINNADPFLLLHRGFWYLLIEWLPRFALSGTALASYAWCTGYIMGKFSGQTRRSSYVVTCAIMAVALLGWEPSTTHTVATRDFILRVNAAVFRSIIYRDVLPELTLLLLVLLPALRGIRDAGRELPRGNWRMVSACLLGIAMSTLIAQTLAPALYEALYLNIAGPIACLISLWSSSKLVSSVAKEPNHA